MQAVKMNTQKRVAQLEMIVLNQILIIDQLTTVVAELVTPAVRSTALDNSAEELLQLMYDDGVPLEALDLAVQWRRRLGEPSITRISG